MNALKKLGNFEKRAFSRLSRVMQNYTFIIRTVWRAAPVYLSILVLIAIVGAILPIVPLFLMREVLNMLIKSSTAGVNTNTIILLITAMGLINFFARFTNSLRTFFSNITVAIIEKHVNIDILTKASTIDMFNIDKKEYNFKLDNARRAIGRRWDDLVLAPVNMFAHAVTLLGLVGILAGLRFWLVLLLIIGILPDIIVQMKTRELLNRYNTSQLDENRKISYLERILSDKNYSKEIRIFNLSKYLVNKVGVLFDKRQDAFKEMRLKELQWNGISSLLSYITITVCQVMIAMMVLKREVNVGDWSLYTGTLQSIAFNLGIVVNIIANSYEENLFSKVLNEFLQIEPQMKMEMGIEYAKAGPDVIEFRNVSFKYPESENYVLRDLNFKIQKGKKIALVGLNGSGKSTLIKLLIRLYDPTEGQILFDGVDIRKYKPYDIYKIYGIVFQDFCRYAFSIRDNITISDIDSCDNEKKILSSSAASGLNSFANKLEHGYDTYISKDYERSGINNLSGGEWQKIAIARAFFRDSPIVILDEPTASLDPKAECEVYDNFMSLCKSKTAVLISHRLSSVRMVDHILFLKDGRIIESGSHSQLQALGGEYAELFNIQAEKYMCDYSA